MFVVKQYEIKTAVQRQFSALTHLQGTIEAAVEVADFIVTLDDIGADGMKVMAD